MLNEPDTHDLNQRKPSPSAPRLAPRLPAATPPPAPTPVHPDTLLRAGIGLGALMIAIAIIWVNGLRRENIWIALQLADLWQVVPGLTVGAVFAWVVWRVGQPLPATRQIVHLIEQTIDLNALRFRHILWFSLLAAIPEEMLFRGALQTSLGLLAAALIFGALHALTRLYFLYATAAGLLLGVLFLVGGSLWLPIGAHFAIDLVMFMLMLQRQRQHPA